MTKTEKAQMLRDVIAGPRGVFAREKGCEVRINGGKLVYIDRKNGSERRISFFEMLSYFHGEDARAIRAAVQ